MAIAYRSGSSAGGSTATSITIDKPAGVVDGDILVINLYKEVASAWTPPAGWTQIANLGGLDGSTIYMTTYWKRASSEGANYTFSVASTWCQATMTAWSGCLAAGDVINVSATNSCTGGIAAHTPVALSITTTVANTMRVAAMIDNSGTNITAGTSGMSQGAEFGGDEFFYLEQAGTGASGDKTFSALADYEHWITVHFALVPAAEGTVVSEGNSTSTSDAMRLGYTAPARALSYVAKSAAVATGTTALSITYPAGIQVGDYCVITITNKYPATTYPSTPTGWGTIADTRSAGGFGVSGVDSGTVGMSLFVRVAVGTESSGTVPVTITSGNSAVGAMTVYRSTTGSVDAAGGTAVDATAGTAWIGTANTTITASGGDYYLVASAINTDGCTFSAEAITQAGIVWGTVTERWDTGTTNGNDCGIVVAEHQVAGGAASSSPVYTMTANTSGTAIPTGAMVFLRMRSGRVFDVIPFDRGSSTSSGDAFVLGGGGGPVTVTMSEGASSSTGDAVPTIGLYSLVVGEGASTSTQDAVVTAGVYPLTMSEGRSATEDNPYVMRGIYPLTVGEGASTSTSDPAVLIGLYNLVVGEGASTSTGDPFVTTGIYPLVMAEGASTTWGDPFVLSTSAGLVVSEGFSSSASDAVTTYGIYGLICSEGASTSTADAFVTRGLYPLVWSEGASTSTGDPFVTLGILLMTMDEGASTTWGDAFVLTRIANFMGLGNRRGYPGYDNGSSLAAGDGARAGLRATSKATGDQARASVRATVDAGEEL